MLPPQKIAQVALQVLQACHKDEALQLLRLAMTPHESPIDPSMKVEELFAPNIQHNHAEQRNYIEVKHLFRNPHIWQPFQGLIKGYDPRTLTYWVNDIKTVWHNLSKSMFWEYRDSIPGGTGRYYFVTKHPAGQRHLVFVVDINFGYKRFTLSILPMDEIDLPEEEEEDEEEYTWEAFLKGDQELDLDEFKKIAQEKEIEYQQIKLIGAQVVFFSENGTKYIADLEHDVLEAQKATDWLDRNMDSAENLVDVDNLDDFWKSPPPLYHATDHENVDSIMAFGLNLESKTRGLTNRWVGAAVFTSMNPEAIDAYGDTIIQIDTNAMARDRYTPRVSLEPGVLEYEAQRSLLSRFDMEGEYILDFPSDGIDTDTVIVDGPIPARYLSLPFN